jgi:hypothetical protein
MKREDLTKLGLAEDVVDKIMSLHGSDIESHKTKLSTAATELEGVKAQLLEAGKQIEAFKGMNIDQIKASADEWKAKAEQATADGAAKIAALQFDHALDSALTGAKAKNAKAVKALLDMNALKYNEADGSVIGLEDQLKKVKETNDYLFASDAPTPKIVAGGNNQSVIGDPVMLAARKAAGLPVS